MLTGLLLGLCFVTLQISLLFNLHSHSNLSDGRLTPEELIRAYREAGYSILAITDHEASYDHTAASGQGG